MVVDNEYKTRIACGTDSEIEGEIYGQYRKLSPEARKVRTAEDIAWREEVIALCWAEFDSRVADKEIVIA